MLAYKTYGIGDPVIIIHGLFGMLDNWQTIAKALSDEYHVITIDLRNHGRSFHAIEMNFEVMCDDIIYLMQELQINRAHIIGHSLGGKVAMHLASDFPHVVDKLIVVDVAPYEYPPYHTQVFEALMAVPLDQMQTRSDVEHILRQHLQQEGEIQFLMKGLTRDEAGQFTWKFNLPVLYKNYIPLIQHISKHPFVGPTLFIKGENSSYITIDKSTLIPDLFPQFELDVIPHAGHWVHADNPTMFVTLTKAFLSK